MRFLQRACKNGSSLSPHEQCVRSDDVLFCCSLHPRRAPILLLCRDRRSLQESQQEAFANAGQFDDSAPSTVNRWYPDLGQNMSGT